MNCTDLLGLVQLDGALYVQLARVFESAALR
jgi:hypothetical protein